MGKALARKKSVANRGSGIRVRRRTTPERGRSGIHNYRAALNFLNSQTNYEKMLRVGYNHTNFNLTRMLKILEAIGNPHKKIRTIHVAGTKGKGSTCHMLAAMVQNCGYRTGLYTSPHVVDIRERIQVDGQMVSEA